MTTHKLVVVWPHTSINKYEYKDQLSLSRLVKAAMCLLAASKYVLTADKCFSCVDWSACKTICILIINCFISAVLHQLLELRL